MMKRIHIMAPTRDMDMTRYQCDAGADELYLGLDGRAINSQYHNFTFNGRYNRMDNVNCQVETLQDLESIIAYAHERGKKINYTANIHYISSDLEKEFDQYIDAGINAGADYIIASSIGTIHRLHQRKLPVPIVAGVFLLTPNVEQIKYLQDLGVVRVVLPQGATIRELEKIRSKTDVELEIFAHFGGGNNCGRCMMLHSPSIVDIGPGCRAAYDVRIGGQLAMEKSYFLDAATDCSLCSLPQLMDIGIDVIKIVGRESANKFTNSKVTELYNVFQNLVLQGLTISQIKQRFKDEELLWTSLWQPRFCERKRCKFHKTEMTDSYII